MPADERPGHPLGPPMARPSLQRPGLQRPGLQRSAARTAVVWDALRTVLVAPDAPDDTDDTDAPDDTARDGRSLSVVDIGGGTGGFAVRVAELGHQVVVIDPSPDALATLARRAEESGVADRVTGRQGDLDSLLDLAPSSSSAPDPSSALSSSSTGGAPSSPGSADVVLCHGVLEIVDDPAAALAALARVLRPGGTLSLLVNQQHAAVIARAMAGHFQQARALLDPTPRAPSPEPVRDGAGSQWEDATVGGFTHRRFTVEEITVALDEAGFDIATMHAVRVFVDLVPSALVDLEPGAVQALVELERAVATRPEYLSLATQVHLLATRR